MLFNCSKGVAANVGYLSDELSTPIASLIRITVIGSIIDGVFNSNAFKITPDNYSSNITVTSAAQAATSTADLTTNATLASSCSIQSQNIDLGSNIAVGSFIFIGSRITLTCNKNLPVQIGFTSTEKSSTDLKQHYLTSENSLNKDKIVVSIGAGLNKFNNYGSITGAGLLGSFTGSGVPKAINGTIRVNIEGFVINDVFFSTNTKITPDNYIGNMTVVINY